MITDGSAQAYLIRADYARGEKKLEGGWQQLGIWFESLGPTSIDVLSVQVIPREAEFAAEGEVSEA